MSEEISEAKFQGWLASSLKNWVPLFVILVSTVAFFVTQSGQIDALANQYDTVNQMVDKLNQEQSELNSTMARIEERTIQIQKDIADIKQRLR